MRLFEWVRGRRCPKCSSDALPPLRSTMRQRSLTHGKKGKTTPKDDAFLTARPAGAPTNIDGAVKRAQAQRKSGDLSAAAHTLSQLVLLAPDDARVLGEYGR